MSFEYSVWAKTPMWEGETDERVFPRLPLSRDLFDVLAASPTPPPYRGGTPKQYGDFLTKLFLHYNNKLLSPANARAVATWLRRWAVDGEATPGLLNEALRVATWLERASDEGWYVDYSM